jgi:hypothetical protein
MSTASATTVVKLLAKIFTSCERLASMFLDVHGGGVVRILIYLRVLGRSSRLR